MFFEALTHFLALDFGWFLAAFMDNLMWFFIFFALIYFFWEGKHTLKIFLVFIALVWAYIDMENITGWSWSVANFLLLYYLTKLAVISIAENNRALKKVLPLVSELQFLLLFALFNLYLRWL